MILNSSEVLSVYKAQDVSKNINKQTQSNESHTLVLRELPLCWYGLEVVNHILQAYPARLQKKALTHYYLEINSKQKRKSYNLTSNCDQFYLYTNHISLSNSTPIGLQNTEWFLHCICEQYTKETCTLEKCLE